MKIACWSGPRNVSTALMRSWSSRIDTFVYDEPFYAYYLKEKKLKHPMYKEIIDYYPNTYDEIVSNITGKIPQSRSIWYQKHMAHHLINFKKIDWIKNFNNCFLIRNPKDVINSYIRKNKLNHIDELGYIQQYRMIEYLKKINKNFIVIDAEILLKNPKKILNKWCKNLEIRFDSNMLKWDRKYYSYDGIWAQHWYDSVIKTNTFQTYKQTNKTKIEEKHLMIYSESLKYYNEMHRLAIE